MTKIMFIMTLIRIVCIANSLGFAYNTLPDTKIADAYREEGVYVLPDSLVAEFFPTLATYPAGIESF